MLRIKFFAVAVVLGLAGVVYAAAHAQDATHHNHDAHGAGKAASCCRGKHQKGGEQAAAMSCDKDGAGCCGGHHSDAAGKDGKGCCAGEGGGCCAAHKKEGAAAEAVKTSAGEQAASCCADGASCCKAHGKDGAQTASADKKGAGCDCCGTSCAAHAGR